MRKVLPVLWILVSCVFSVRAQVPNARKPLSASEIFARSRGSVVVILATDENGKRQVLGSGFIVKRNEIVTNHHVLEGMSKADVVFSNGDVQEVSGVAADSRENDLIVLSCRTGNRSALALGDELSLDQGSAVYALGAPQGLELSLTNGIVSSFRNVGAQFLIQNTATISHGSSGGPLFDASGRVVGITSSMLEDSPGIYFAIGAGDLKRLLRTPSAVNLSLSAWADEQNGDNSTEASASNHGASDTTSQTAAPSQPPPALLTVSPLRVGYELELEMAGNSLRCAMDGPTALRCEKYDQYAGYVFNSFLTAMMARKPSGTSFLMGCPPSPSCPPLVPGDYAFEEAGRDSIVIKGLVAETPADQTGTTGIYSILAYEDSSAGPSASSGDAAAALQIFDSLSGADQAYVRTFCDENPDQSALVPQDHPTHVINCQSWKAAEVGK